MRKPGSSIHRSVSRSRALLTICCAAALTTLPLRAAQPATPALGPQPSDGGETAVRPQRVSGSIPEGKETVLDRIVHLEEEFLTEIPQVPRWCARLELAGRRVDVGDAELYVEEEGRGPALVLIHGGPGGTHHYFHPWFSRAAEFARVVYYDQRGCGQSDFEPGPNGYSVEQAVEDLDSLRQALGLERWVLYGYSYGGFLAQLYTLRHPGRVAGLVLQSAVPGMWADLGSSRQEEFFSPQEKARKDAILAELRQRREEEDWSSRRALQLLIYNWGLNGDWKRQHFLKPSPERLALRALYEWEHDRDFNSVMSRSRERVDFTGAFDDNPIPTLLLEGEWDLTWGEKKRDVLAGNHPRARYLLFENAGHNIYKEQPEALFAALAEFMRQLPEISPATIEAYRRKLARWRTAHEATPLYKLRAAGSGLASSRRLAADYDRGWLELFPEPDNLLRLGFALYDVGELDEALAVFEALERSARAAANHGWESVALIWQGHMLDLLDRRSEALESYRHAAALDNDEQWFHSAYRMVYRPAAYARERKSTPFAGLENQIPD